MIHVFLGYKNHPHSFKKDRSQFKFKHALDDESAIKTVLSFLESDEFENFTKIRVVV